ncbi:hypothetical protein KIL84_004156, partial [Mauremys mutica]
WTFIGLIIKHKGATSHGVFPCEVLLTSHSVTFVKVSCLHSACVCSQVNDAFSCRAVFPQSQSLDGGFLCDPASPGCSHCPGLLLFLEATQRTQPKIRASRTQHPANYIIQNGGVPSDLILTGNQENFICLIGK